MNSKTRAALVRILTDVSVRYERSRFPQQFEEAIDTAIEEIEALLADRAETDEVWLGNAYNAGYRAALAAVPTVQAAADDALLDSLGPGATVTYIGQEGELWWVELRLPESRYTATLVTDSGSTPDEALQITVDRALTFAKEQEVKV